MVVRSDAPSRAENGDAQPFVCRHDDPRCEDDPCPAGIQWLCNAPADHPRRARPAQEFERYPALASWIERLANVGSCLSLGEWMIFVQCLNNALAEARSAQSSQVEERDGASQDLTEDAQPFSHLQSQRSRSTEYPR